MAANAPKNDDTVTDGLVSMRLTPQQVELLRAAEESQKAADARDTQFHNAIAKPANTLTNDEKQLLRSIVDDYNAGRIPL